MKKWVILISTFSLITISVISYFYYITIRSPIISEQIAASEFILEHTDAVTIKQISYYHGINGYQVARALDINEEEIIIWVRNDFEEMVVRNAEDGLSKDEIINLAKTELAPKRINNIRLGLENGVPIYEINYLDQDNRFAYYYVTFKDGTFVKRYSFKRS